MKAYYCDHFALPLPAGHRFPIDKYSMLRESVLAERIVRAEDMHVPDPVTDEDIERAHDCDYVKCVIGGNLSASQIRRIGFPWSPQLVERARRSAGGTLAACHAALEDGVAVNLAGGTHHAGTGHGEGFCIFNDSGIAVRAMQAERSVSRVSVVDLDVHQGNGTAELFADDPTVFTLSVHGVNNFPFRKARSDRDIPLEDGATDEEYLTAVQSGLTEAIGVGMPDLVIYVSGADAFEGDRLGKLAVTKQGLAARDKLVFDTLRKAGIPVAVVMAGGYAANVADTVAIHVQTIRTAALASMSCTNAR